MEMTEEFKYEQLSCLSLNNYLDDKIGKIFKILPLYENNVETLSIYIESLNIELCGAMNLFTKLKDNADYLSIIATLEYFMDTKNLIDKLTCKREVFKCIGLIKQLKE